MERIHGVKKDLYGPSHVKEGDTLCNDGLCESCARKIFKLHYTFFQNEYRQKVIQQHGEAAACTDSACKECNFEGEDIHCPGEGCDAETGKTRTGVLACEIFQIHPNNVGCNTNPGPVKRCGCKIHIKSWVICSFKCQKNSKYAKCVPGMKIVC